MSLMTRVHPHAPDDREPDEAGELAEEIRSRFVDWDPLRDVTEAIESWPSRPRRRHKHVRFLRAWRRRIRRR